MWFTSDSSSFARVSLACLRFLKLFRIFRALLEYNKGKDLPAV